MVALSMALFHAPTYDSALQVAIQARQLSDKIRYKKGKALALLASGYAYKLKGSYLASLNDFKEAVIVFEDLSDKLNIGKSHSFMAQTYQSMGAHAQAINHLEIAREHVEQIGHQPGLSVIYLDIGRYYSEQGNFEIALEYYHKSFKSSESIQALSKMAMALNNIGVVYERMDEHEKALDYFTQAITLLTKGDIISKKALVLLNRGRMLVQLSRLGEGEKCLKEGLQIAEETGDKECQALALRNIAALVYKTGDPINAERLYKQSVLLGREMNNPDLIMTGLFELAEFYLNQHNPERAYNAASESFQLTRYLRANEYRKKLLLLNAKIDSAQGNFRSAFEWHKKYILLNDSILMSRDSANIKHLQRLLDEKKKTVADSVRVEIATTAQGTNSLKYNLALLLLTIILLLVIVTFFRIRRNKLSNLHEDALRSAE